MVPGLDSFREKFKNYTDYYTIIGGTACDILLSEADLSFRATKDIDMILIMEDNFPEFASIFWEYIKEGGYKCGLFTSPHLVKMNERIVLNGKQISDEDFCEVFEETMQAVRRMQDAGLEHPTFFEFLFAMAMKAYDRAGMDQRYR